MTQTTNIQEIIKSLQFPNHLQEMTEAWESEKESRKSFWKKSGSDTKAEFINGVGYYHAPSTEKIRSLKSKIGKSLLLQANHNNLGKCSYEKAMIRCNRNDYEPDICFWRKEVSDTFQEKQSAFPPPHFVVEVLSDSTEERDRGIKFEDYALHGVEEY